jgi:hypothetical protein
MTPFNRRLLYFVLLFTCVEGLVINITFPSKIGYVAKDVMLVAGFALLLSSSQGQSYGSLRSLTMPLGLFAAVQIAYLFMPVGDLPFLAKAVGLKMRLLYLTAMFLGYRFVRSGMDVYRMTAVLAIAAIPVSLFGIYLFFAGPAALQAIGGSYSAILHAPQGGWRVPGTFTSPGQYGLYLTFNAIITMSLLLVPNLTARYRALLWVSLVVMVLAILVSGSRTPMLLTIAAGAVMMLGIGSFGKVVTMGATAYIALAIGFATFGAGVEDRVGSIASMDHVERFNRTYFGQMFIPKMLETPFGLGLGAATIGARHFTEFNEILLVESYFGVIAIETGLIGLATIIILTASILLYLFKARGVMRGSPSAPAWYALASFILIVVLLSPVGTALDSAPGNLYFWLSLGMAAKLYDLERAARAAALSQTSGRAAY